MRVRGAVLAVAAGGLVTGGTAVASAAAADSTQAVAYQGYTFTVPASWPVIDLAKQPHACVRYDRHALYLGTPGAQQDCPARLVGHTEALLVQPTSALGGGSGAGGGGGSASIVDHTASDEFDATAPGVKILGSYNSDPGLVSEVLTRALPAGTPVTDGSPAARAAAAASSATVDPGAVNFTGTGVDTCAAPSESVMAQWMQDKVAGAVGLNIGGADESCKSQPNLTAQWVADEAKAGWHFWLDYTGPQAPGSSCAGCDVITDPAGQAQTAAQDAVNQAKSLGFPAGIPLVYDMQGYTQGGGNTTTALQFESDWTTDLHKLGYQSGVYGPMDSTVQDLTTAYGGVYTMPDLIDFASDDQDASVSDPAIPAADWPSNQRINQYDLNVTLGTGDSATNVDYDSVNVDRVPVDQPADLLYTISDNNQSVTESLGDGSWLTIGGETFQLYVGQHTVFGTDLDYKRGVYEYDGVPGQWTRIGGGGKQFAVVGDTLYGLTPDGAAVERWNGGTSWTRVGGAASAIYGGSFALVATNPGNTAVFKYNPTGNSWAQIGTGGKNYVEHGQTLYGVAKNGSLVAQWSGTGRKWTVIGGEAVAVFGSPTDDQLSGPGLFASAPRNEGIYEYDGVPGKWTRIGGAGGGFTVSGSGLYGLSSGGHVYKWSGSGSTWNLLLGGHAAEWIASVGDG